MELKIHKLHFVEAQIQRKNVDATTSITTQIQHVGETATIGMYSNILYDC